MAGKENEKNIFVFADHTGEIFIKQIIVGDENIKKYNKLRRKSEAKNNKIKQSIRIKEKEKDKEIERDK